MLLDHSLKEARGGEARGGEAERISLELMMVKLDNILKIGSLNPIVPRNKKVYQDDYIFQLLILIRARAYFQLY